MAGVVLGIACIDMSAPKGPASISSLVLPSPSVFLSDVMRDSNGAPAPLRILAYDAAGVLMTGLSTQFFITDTGTSARLRADTLVAGDKPGVIHVVGQIGLLQTPVVTVPITYAPAKIAASGTPAPIVGGLTGDSAKSIGSTSLAAVVKSGNDSVSQGIVVRYTLVRGPASQDPKSPAVFLTDDSGLLSSADTTDASGVASRRLVVVAAHLADQALLTGKRTDTAIVEARASYRGTPLAGSPVSFLVPITVAIK